MPIEARPWEVWHDEAMPGELDAYWRNSGDEMDYRRMLARLVADHLPADGSVLEVGCGTGLIYEALLDAVGPLLDYTGVDNSRPMLAYARRAYPGAKFRHGDAFNLRFSDRSFDLACAFEVFGHMPLPAWPICELLRVGRTAIFTLWLYEGDAPRKGQDHYEHPVDAVTEILNGTGRYWTWRDMPHTRAYIVEAGR